MVIFIRVPPLRSLQRLFSELLLDLKLLELPLQSGRGVECVTVRPICAAIGEEGATAYEVDKFDLVPTLWATKPSDKTTIACESTRSSIRLWCGQRISSRATGKLFPLEAGHEIFEVMHSSR